MAALAVALPLIVFAIVMIVVVGREQERSVEDLLRQATAAAVRTVDERIATSRGALEMLAFSRFVADGGVHFVDRAERALRQRPDWLALERRGRDHSAQIVGRPDDPDVGPLSAHLTDDALDALFRTGATRVSDILIDPARRVEPAIAVTVPEFGDRGINYVLTAYVRASSIGWVLRSQNLAPGWRVAVLDGERKMLARTLSDDPFDPVLGTPPDSSVIDALNERREFFYSTTQTGEQLYAAAAPSLKTGWTVILGAPASLLEKTAQRTLLAVSWGSLAAFALTGLLGWVLARSYMRREAAERRVVALEAAARAEQRSLAILESTTDGVFELDRAWRITFINSRARAMLADGRDIAGTVLWEAFPEAAGNDAWEQCQRAMERREPVAFEVTVPHLGRCHAVRAFPTEEGLAVYIQDITERRRTEQALEEAHQQANDILESIGDAFYATDGDLNFTYVNTRALELFGKRREEMIGAHFFDVFPTVKGNAIHEIFNTVMSDRQARDFEACSGILKRWTSFSIYPRTTGGISVYFRDISGQKAAEAALRASELRYRTLVEALPQLVWTCSSDGICDFLSSQWIAYTGRPEAEQLGYGWTDAIHPDDRERLVTVWEQAVASGSTFDTEVRLRRADGIYRWFKQRAVPLRDPEGTVDRWFGTSTDVTDVIEARNAMQEAKEEAELVGLRFRTMADSIPQLAWMAEPNGSIFWFNQRWYDFTGTTLEEMAGWGWRSTHHPDHIDRVLERLQRSLDTGEPWEDTFPMRAKDGTFRWFLSRALPVRDANGAIILWFGTNTDVTEHLAAEEALRIAKEEAERAALSKSKFLASASHDLRQPMQSLFLFAGALHGHIQSDKGREALRLMESGLDALKGLMDSLLDVSRLDASVVKPTLEDFPIALLLDHIAASYAPVAKSKGLTWSVPTSPLHVHSDRVLLGRIIRNLVENAIRYTAHGGIQITCTQVEDRLRIAVTDTGIGISDQHRQRIFDEFYQVGNPERDRSQGLGLGLAIVQRISRLLAYPVSVQSELGKGSTFAVDVPLAAGKVSAEVQTLPSRPAAGHGEKRFAVVIDDDAIVLLGLQAILKEWGYTVLIAGSGEQAIDRLRTATRLPDIVIADYRLREGKIGTDAILAIREFLGSPVPGIIVTGETGSECQRDAAIHGFGLMHKPVTPRQLGGAMEQHLKAAS